MSIKFVKALKPAETYTHTHTCSLLLSFLSIILISAPAFSYVTNSSHCDNDVLSTYSGSANLTANWQGNPISVTWYNGDTQYDSNQCTYGGNLTMPSSIPQKTGYTFRGWRVRQAPVISLSSLNTSIGGTWHAVKTAGGCFYDSSTNQSTNCAESYFTGLSNGEWAVGFSYGTIKGTATCTGSSRVEPNSYAFEAGDYVTLYAGCECAITGFTPSGGSLQNLSNPSAWNLDTEISVNNCGGCAGDDYWCLDEAQACVADTSNCAGNCPYYCAQEVRYSSETRTWLYGQGNY